MRDDAIEDDTCPLTVADIGGMDNELEDESLRIDDQMAFTAIESFPSIVAAQPPFSVVLTDWLSIMAPLGSGSRPARSRTSSRNP